MTESRYARTSTIVPFTKRHTQQYRLSNRRPFFAVASECNSTTAQSPLSSRCSVRSCAPFGKTFSSFSVDVTQNVYNRTWWEERVEAVSMAAATVWREFLAQPVPAT